HPAAAPDREPIPTMPPGRGSRPGPSRGTTADSTSHRSGSRPHHASSLSPFVANHRLGRASTTGGPPRMTGYLVGLTTSDASFDPPYPARMSLGVSSL